MLNLPKLVNFTNGDQIEIIYNAKGKLMKRIYHTASTTTENMYQYNGKEMLDFNGYNMNDYGARYYDTALGRWNVLDPLVEKYHAFSPYNFVANTPLKHVDKDGRVVTASDQSTKDLILNTMAFAFGANHVFSFKGNNLIFSGVVSDDLRSEQQLLLRYFVDILICSEMNVEVFSFQLERNL